MGLSRLIQASLRSDIVLLILCAGLLLATGGCTVSRPVEARSAASTPLVPVSGKEVDPFVRENLSKMKTPASEPTSPVVPGFQPVSDDISPAKTRLVNIQARNSALSDILHIIADTAGMNLIINEGVQQDRPVTITLKRVTAEDAFATLLDSADYYYTIKDNTITVDPTGTKTFELGHPALVQGFNVEVGGDILGGAASVSAGGSSGGGASNIKGTITQSVKSDGKAFDFWDALEKTLQGILGTKESSAARASSAPQADRTGTLKVAQAAPTSSLQELSRGQTFTSPHIQAEAPGSGEKSGPRQYVAINRLTGTIMVTATRKNLQHIASYLETLRRTLNRQVLVEARVIEVQLSDTFKFGIDWDFLTNARWFNTTGVPFGGFGSSRDSLSAAISSGAFRIGYTGGNTQALLTALKTQGEVKTLSNPRINVMNGQTALLTVGRNFNYIAKVTTTSTTASGSIPTITYSVETGNVLSGIILGLAPHINNKGEISLTVTPIISDLVKLEDKIIGSDVSNQIKISIPTVDLRELSTTVKVRNGEMIVIGGLIANKQDFEDEKIPLLGDIPWMGSLFTRKNNTDKRTELVVVLQPYLIIND